MKHIGLKFCGGCNPQIDRSALFKELKSILPEGYRLVTDSPADAWEMALMVCGCPVACADRPEIRKLAHRWVVVSGLMVDSLGVSEQDLPGVVLKKLFACEYR